MGCSTLVKDKTLIYSTCQPANADSSHKQLLSSGTGVRGRLGFILQGVGLMISRFFYYQKIIIRRLGGYWGRGLLGGGGGLISIEYFYLKLVLPWYVQQDNP